MKVNKSWLLLIAIGFLLLLPRLIWFFSDPRTEEVAILDKTVPTEDKREHRALSWVLQYLKFANFSGENDYYGYFPEQKTNVKKLPGQLEGAGIIYAADTYGVYDEKGRLVYGGLQMNEWMAMKQQAIDSPATLILEFNTLASPTTPEVKKDAAAFLHASPTGWTGRAFQDLKKSNAELAPNLVASYEKRGEEWTFTGAGFVLVNEEAGDVVVLSEEQGDINEAVLQVVFTEKGKEATGINQKTPYTYWFDITVPDNEEDVWATYEWSLTGKGTEQLEQRNIPLAFPAVVHHAGGQSDLFYFAGDFADTAHASPVHKYSGYAAARALVTPAALYPEQAFFWKTYVPLMKSVLSMEK